MHKHSLIIILFVFLFYTIFHTANARETKFYSTSSGLIYMRVTDIIYNKGLQMDGGVKKPAAKGNIFAQVMINFANLTDKPVKDYGLNPVTLSVSPQRLYLIGNSGKKYAGIKATRLLRSDLKPFREKVTLKPGEDMVRAMAFVVPEKDPIAAIVYRFEGGYELKIDYRTNEQLIRQKYSK